MSRVTSRITGASDARSFSCWTSASNASSSPRVSIVADDLAHRGLAAAVEALERRVELARASRPSAAPRARSPSRTRRSCSVSVGSAIASAELVVVLAHRQRARVAQEARRHALLEDRQLRIARRRRPAAAPSCAASASATSRCATSAERHQQRAQPLAGVLLESQGALERSAASSLPRSIRSSPSRRRGIDIEGPVVGRSVRSAGRGRVHYFSRAGGITGGKCLCSNNLQVAGEREEKEEKAKKKTEGAVGEGSGSAMATPALPSRAPCRLAAHWSHPPAPWHPRVSPSPAARHEARLLRPGRRPLPLAPRPPPATGWTASRTVTRTAACRSPSPTRTAGKSCALRLRGRRGTAAAIRSTSSARARRLSGSRAVTRCRTSRTASSRSTRVAVPHGARMEPGGDRPAQPSQGRHRAADRRRSRPTGCPTRSR